MDPLTTINGEQVELYSVNALAARVLMSRSSIQRAFVFGTLKPVRSDFRGHYFRKHDLDKLRDEGVLDIARSCAHLSATEKERVFFATISARENDRKEPNAADLAEGGRRSRLLAKAPEYSARYVALWTQFTGRSASESTRSTLTTRAAFRTQFRARVDASAGILHGVTIAESGVDAQGHSIAVDSSGRPTKDPSQARKTIPQSVDDETLSTVLAAAKKGGGEFRVRADHADTLTSRIGSATNFRREGNKVVCDIALLDSYPARAQVLEIAKKNPALIAASMDLSRSFDIKNGKAFLRCTSLHGVDLVDEGAITPGGL